MSVATILFAPLMVLLPAAGSVAAGPDLSSDSASGESDARRASDAGQGLLPPAPASPIAVAGPGEGGEAGERVFRFVVDGLRMQEARQVRIEQRVTVRVIPRSAPVQRNMLMDLPDREIAARFEERKIGKCLPASAIAGVQARGSNQLLLFMRDQRIVAADLERSCRSRDFYSGFYLARSNDDRLCVDRDMLLSRSGANCKLTRLRQLVESED